MESETHIEFEADDIIALYLLEHPEDADGFLTATSLDGTESQVMVGEVAVRFGRWGIEKGYFHPEKVYKFIDWAEQSPLRPQEPGEPRITPQNPAAPE